MNIAVAGLGLIGGSLALALRGTHQLRGYDTDAGTRDAAGRAGIQVVASLDDLLPADAVIVATPLAAVLPTLAHLAPRAERAVLLDVASVRAPVDAFARDQQNGARLVGMHPMAGRSAQGFAAADPDLLRGRPFLVVPTARSDADAMAVAGALARDAGGVVTVMSAAEHDRIVAVLSALPLALAAALSVTAAEAIAAPLEGLAGTGFRDATRLALTTPELGEPLLAANSAHVVGALARLREALDEIERAVAERDHGALRELLERAALVRKTLD